LDLSLSTLYVFPFVYVNIRIDYGAPFNSIDPFTYTSNCINKGGNQPKVKRGLNRFIYGKLKVCNINYTKEN